VQGEFVFRILIKYNIMAGHNKWSKVKHKKAATDAQKSKQFSKMSQIITLEAKKCDGNRQSPGLKAAIERAKSVNMPNDNIERAIKKATEAGSALEEVRYEAYGPGGCAMIIEGVTDNRNRMAAEIKNILSKHNIDLAQPGSATWAFQFNNGEWENQTAITLSNEDSEKLERLIEVLEDNDDVQAVYTNAETE